MPLLAREVPSWSELQTWQQALIYIGCIVVIAVVGSTLIWRDGVRDQILQLRHVAAAMFRRAKRRETSNSNSKFAGLEPGLIRGADEINRVAQERRGACEKGSDMVVRHISDVEAWRTKRPPVAARA